MNQYRNLKDLPGAPAGTVWIKSSITNQLYYDQWEPVNGPVGLKFNEQFITSFPDWFALVNPETLEDAVLRVINESDFAVNTDMRNALNNLRNVYNRVKEGK